MIYAVVDTNVLISSLLTSNENSPTIEIIRAIRERKIIPVYSKGLLNEYEEVLHRDKFRLNQNTINLLLRLFTDTGEHFEPEEEYIVMPDSDDVPIYLIALQTRNLDSYLITGNIKHFPKVDFVVTPRKMVEILSRKP